MSKHMNAKFRWRYCLILSLTVLAVTVVARAIKFDANPSYSNTKNPSWHPPVAQTFSSAWGHPEDLINSGVPTTPQLERLLARSSELQDNPDVEDFSFFKKNSDGSWHTALEIGVDWHPLTWSILTLEQISEMKSRLDQYLLSVAEFETREGDWKPLPVGLRCELIPIAFSPRRGSLLCLDSKSDLMYVLANNNDQIDVGTYNYHPSAKGRLIIHPTNTRLQAVLDFGQCNDKHIVLEDRLTSANCISQILASAGAGIGVADVPVEKSDSIWKSVRYTDVVGGGLLVVLITYSAARVHKESRAEGRHNQALQRSRRARPTY